MRTDNSKKNKTSKTWRDLVILLISLLILGVYSHYRKTNDIDTVIGTDAASQVVTVQTNDATGAASLPGTATPPATAVQPATTEAEDIDPVATCLALGDCNGEAVVAVNGNYPFFTDEELSEEAYQEFSELDELGRCGPATACLMQSMMPDPDEDRGDISSVKPTGWNSYAADDVDGGWLYNRCHLIGYQITGENANPLNLITGTRQLNVDGMLPFENEVADVLEAWPELHVMYRVTPIFYEDELVARGVLMEAFSVDDNGLALCFCVYVPNIQEGWTIDYRTGFAAPVESEAGA